MACNVVRIVLFFAMALPGIAWAVEPCRITVVERESGWPVPLVELRTTHHVSYVTDNAGVVAVDDPELLGREVWFDVHGHGYQVEPDGFGNAGVRLTPKPGQELRIEVERTSLARRLGRLTGAGLFAESRKLGDEFAPLDTGVFGCDSVQCAIYRGKCYWLWGDTTLPGYPLGVFDSTSATTAVEPLDSFEPPLELQYDYFRDQQGRPRGVAPIPGDGPTWLSAYVCLPDRNGDQRLVATYRKIDPPLSTREAGLCVWNDESQEFERLKTLWTKDADSERQPPMPDGHAAFWTDVQGERWVLFGNPLPRLRCRATFEAWQDPEAWEPLEPQQQLQSTTGEEVRPHTGSIAWNEYRGRWVTVFMQAYGEPSALGELWYAEADSPLETWGPAIKVLSHDNYTFYNPRLHAEFTDPGSPLLLFEGTYTVQFADDPEPTPRYDYNQVLYRLDLDDPQLAPAQSPAADSGE